MTEEITAYDHKKHLAIARKSIEKSKMSEKNKETIFRFMDFILARNFSQSRITKYLWHLKTIAEWLDKDFMAATKDDLIRVVGIIHGRDISDWTKHGYKVVLRKFYQWLCDFGTGTKFPAIVSWIEISRKISNKKLISSEGLLTEKDVIDIVDKSDNVRDKALIYLLWESGARIGEIASLRIKNVKFDDYGATVYIEKGKTGGRPIRIVNSVPYIATWLNIHPRRKEREAPLWVNLTCSNRGKVLKYPSYAILLRRAFNKAGVAKKANPHFFRHSRATEMANHLTEFQMNQYFGWKQGSSMPSIYVHLSGKNTDEAVLKMHGLQKEQSEEDELKPRICPRCKKLNAPKQMNCFQCGFCFEPMKAAMPEHEERTTTSEEKEIALLKAVMSNPEIQKLVLEKMRKELSLT